VSNPASQLSPLIVILVGFWFHATWDKGMRAIFYLYLTAGLFEIIHVLIGGLPIMFHLWTPIEVGFLLYIYSQWSDFNYKAVFIVYMIIWIIIKATGLEPINGLNMDTLSLVFASLIFIITPMYVFENLKSYQKCFMLLMAIYYGGCLVFFLTINVLENKDLAWNVHNLFNIITAIGTAAIFIIRNNDIILSTRSFTGGSSVDGKLLFIRKK